jgi:hypothetical protein
MKTSVRDLIEDLCALEEEVVARAVRADASICGKVLGALRLKKPYLSLRAVLAVMRRLRRHARISRALKGRSIGKTWHAVACILGLLLGRKSSDVMGRHTNIHELFQLIVLPFEDTYVLETDRLERCPNAFAFLDPATQRVRTVPVCAWSHVKKEVFRRIADHYAAAPAGAEKVAQA